MAWCLLSHGSYEPFFIWGESPEAFAVTAQVPLVGDFVLAKRQTLKVFILNQHPLPSAEASVTLLLSALLRTSEVGARRRSFSTLTHSVSNVMGSRMLSMRHPVKHYETVGAVSCSINSFRYATTISFSSCVNSSNSFTSGAIGVSKILLGVDFIVPSIYQLLFQPVLYLQAGDAFEMLRVTGHKDKILLQGRCGDEHIHVTNLLTLFLQHIA